ncbi:MAG: hypothetical protein GQ527_02035 [Bacteroidales bacterium]|nr:hypothetical protein [Bacteroidales bacterium]
MPREVKILIPDSQANESVDINVVVGGEQIVQYRLEVINFNQNETDLTRAQFIKEKLKKYDRNFTIVEVGLEGQDRIPVLFRQIQKQ